MSRVLVIGCTERLLERARDERPRGWFGPLERSIQLARTAAASHDVLMALLGAEAQDVELARRASDGAFEVQPVSVASDLVELHQHVVSFSPTALVSTTLLCASRTRLLNTQIPIWCDFLAESVARSLIRGPQFALSGRCAREAPGIDEILSWGDRFSSSSPAAAGALLGRLTASGRFADSESPSARDPDFDSTDAGATAASPFDLVTLLPSSYSDLRSIYSRTAHGETFRHDPPGAFRVLCMIDSVSGIGVCPEASPQWSLVERVLAAVMASFGELHAVVPRASLAETRLSETFASLVEDGRVTVLEEPSRDSLPSLYERCGLALITGPEAWEVSERLWALHEEMVALGLPVLFVDDRGPGCWGRHSPSLVVERDATAIARKLIWALRHRELLQGLSGDHSSDVGLHTGRSRLLRWLDDPEPAARLPEARSTPPPVAEPVPPPRDIRSRLRLWLETL